TGRMLYSGFVPAQIRAGTYSILVKNTCSTCGAAQILPTSYTALEPLSEISTLRFLDTNSEQEAFNSTDNVLELEGKYLSSVSEVRISSDLITLTNQFSSQESLPVVSTTTNRVRVNLLQGYASAQYWVGVRNQAGVSIAPMSFL